MKFNNSDEKKKLDQENIINLWGNLPPPPIAPGPGPDTGTWYRPTLDYVPVIESIPMSRRPLLSPELGRHQFLNLM